MFTDSTPGNVRNISMKVDKGQNPMLIKLEWIPPSDKGSLGVIAYYKIKWGQVTQPDNTSLFKESKFISTPNVTIVANVSMLDMFF